MYVTSNLFNPELNNFRKHSPSESIDYFVIEEGEIFQEGVIIRIDKGTELDKFVRRVMPYLSSDEYIRQQVSNYKVFDNIEDFYTYQNKRDGLDYED